jgi:hypothetical protein
MTFLLEKHVYEVIHAAEGSSGIELATRVRINPETWVAEISRYLTFSEPGGAL